MVWVVIGVVTPLVMAPVAASGDMRTFSSEAWKSIGQRRGLWSASSVVIPFGVAHLGMLAYLIAIRPKLLRCEPRPPRVRYGDEFRFVRGPREGTGGTVLRPSGWWRVDHALRALMCMPAELVLLDGRTRTVLRSSIAPVAPSVRTE